MLTRIKMRNVASYNDEGITLESLKPVNFIYGANGSGKTTIGSFIKDNTSFPFRDCELEWLNDIPLVPFVYNRDFVLKNISSSSIKGVFTLGQATLEEKERIQSLKQILEEKKEHIRQDKVSKDKVKSELDKLESDFKEYVWQHVFKDFENAFKEAFRGFLNNKSTFFNKVLSEYDSDSELIEYQSLVDRYNTAFKSDAKQLPLIPSNSKNLESIEANDIWERKIIGSSDVDISALIQTLHNHDWVRQGVTYLNPDSDICPFCQQPTLNELFKNKLKSYFDSSYESDHKAIQELRNLYLTTATELFRFYENILRTEKENKESKLDINEFGSTLEILRSRLSENKEKLEAKGKEPSRAISLSSTSDTLTALERLVNEANTLISSHNHIIDNLKAEKELLCKQIWKFCTNSYLNEIQIFVRERNGKNRGVLSLSERINNQKKESEVLEAEITELNKNITSVQPTIDEINRLLRKFGFNNFRINPLKEDPNQYQICRLDGSPVLSTLSEGEITFITFLYYYQLVKGGHNPEQVSSDRILLIDDPVSSLDSSILFIVSTLIKELIKDVKKGNSTVKQIIILTHNVYFHKEVSFIDGRNPERNDTSFWMLRKRNNITEAKAFEHKNPIVGSYEMLWRELKEVHSSVSVQNIMRRILENYFKLLGKYDDSSIIMKFDSPEEQTICRSLISWINDGSHSLPDDYFLEDSEEVIAKYLNVFERIFEEMGHKAHYEMMMRNVSTLKANWK